MTRRRDEQRDEAFLQRYLGPREQRTKAWKKVRDRKSNQKAALESLQQRRADHLHVSPTFHHNLGTFRRKWLRKPFTPVKVPGTRFAKPPRTLAATREYTLEFPDEARDFLYALKNAFLRRTAHGSRRRDYEHDLDLLCYRHRLPPSWREYVEACVFLDRPPQHMLPSGATVKIESVTHPDGILPGLHPFPLRGVAHRTGFETPKEWEYAERVRKATHEYLRLPRAKVPRSTLNVTRRTRIKNMIDRNRREHPHRPKNLIQLYHAYLKKYPDDQPSESAFRSTVKRLHPPTTH